MNKKFTIMQRLLTITNALCNKTRLLPKTLSIRNFISDIRDNNEIENKFNNEESQDSATMSEEKKLGGFARAFEKFNQSKSEPEPENEKTFANLLRYSKFIDIGDAEGKFVTGKIFHVVDNDLYIDFGWKFHCVCVKPLKNGRDYVRGASVKLMIKNLELSTKFLGGTKDITIMEADCILMGIIHTPLKNIKSS